MKHKFIVICIIIGVIAAVYGTVNELIDPQPHGVYGGNVGSVFEIVAFNVGLGVLLTIGLIAFAYFFLGWRSKKT
jgi:hypothetical protein